MPTRLRLLVCLALGILPGVLGTSALAAPPAQSAVVEVSVDEEIEVNDAPGVSPTANVTVGETIVIRDDANAGTSAAIDVGETIRIDDDPSATTPVVIGVDESIGVDDSTGGGGPASTQLRKLGAFFGEVVSADESMLVMRIDEGELCVRPVSTTQSRAHERPATPYGAAVPEVGWRIAVHIVEGDPDAPASCFDEIEWYAVNRSEPVRTHEWTVVLQSGGDSITVAAGGKSRTVRYPGGRGWAEQGDEAVLVKAFDPTGRERVVAVVDTRAVRDRLERAAESASGSVRDTAGGLILQGLDERVRRLQAEESAARVSGDAALHAMVQEALRRAERELEDWERSFDGLPTDPQALACIERVLGRVPTAANPPTEDERRRAESECGRQVDGPDIPDDPRVVACIERVLGRPIGDGTSITREERDRIESTCPGLSGPGAGDRGEIPNAEALACIERVLGRLPTAADPPTEDERRRSESECGRQIDGPDIPDDPRVVVCIERVLGRPIGDGTSITREERDRIESTCSGLSAPGAGDRGEIPNAEALACIERVLGRPFGDGRSVTTEERLAFERECRRD